jgi:hypothetical protein
MASFVEKSAGMLTSSAKAALPLSLQFNSSRCFSCAVIEKGQQKRMRMKNEIERCTFTNLHSFF